MKNFLKTVAEWILGDPRDYAMSNANFFGFAIPALAGIVGSIFKKKSQDSAINNAYKQQQQQQQYELAQRRAAIENYNAQRTQSVQRKRDLLKAYMMNKGYNNNKMFETLGGFDQFFSRPINGLQDANQLSAAPIFKPQGTSWWDMGGQAIGAGAKAYADYKAGQEQNDQFNNSGGGGGFNFGSLFGGGGGGGGQQAPNPFQLQPKPKAPWEIG
jgi:hypothetical protein